MEFELTRDWNNYLNLFPKDKFDVYSSPQYVRLYETENDEAICFVCRSEIKVLIFPFLRREFNFNGKRYFDFETAYGYGGPISNTDDIVFIQRALQLFNNYCTNNDYVCGFIRFNPLLGNSKHFESIGQVLLDRKTVGIDLTKSEDEIWMNSIVGKNRSSIKKSISRGLTFEADYSFTYLEDFINLYNDTMNKLNAHDFYLFNNNYYKNWISNISNSFLGVVKFENKVISAAIFFFSNHFGHYHLAGSDPHFLKLNPNNFMLWEAAKELKRNNVKLFHLGGGSDGDSSNSLLSFKSRFSPLRYDFNIGRLVFNPNLYEQICNQWEEINAEKAVIFKNYLLKYKY